MEVKRMFVTLTSLMALSLGPVSAQAQTGTDKVNEKFHIYLCLGQSNMEGNAKIEACDGECNSAFQGASSCRLPGFRTGKR